MEKLMRQQVDIDNMQLDFMPECETTNIISILRWLQEKYLPKIEKIELCICRFGEGFWSNA